MKNENNIKRPLIIITYAIIAFFVINNLSLILNWIDFSIKILSPFLIGIGISFIINLLMRFYEINLLDKLFKVKKLEKLKKAKRPFGMILAYISAAAIVVIIINFIIPQIAKSITSLAEKLPSYLNDLSSIIQGIAQNHNFTKDIWTQLVNNLDKIISNTSQFLNALLPQLYNLTKGLTTGVLNIFLGFVFSVYMLASKEKLIDILKRIICVLFKKNVADKIIDVSCKANKIFRSFIGGQLIESAILGILCFVGMSIFRMPYAPLVSVIIGVSSLVPVLGTYIGVIISAFLILLESPVVAFWFVIFIIILQQIEGNLIYPKVVGNAIGLSGLWVLLAVTIGGSLFGVLGILLGVPVMAVIYSLVRSYVNKKEKEIKE